MKKYNEPLRLAFDLMRSVRANIKNDPDMGVPVGNFQFSVRGADGKYTTHALRKNDDKMLLANTIISKSLQKPVAARSWDGKLAQIQAFTGASSLPDIDTGQAWSATVNTRDYDVGYRSLFQLVTLNPGTLDFTIAIGKKGAKMVKIPEGGRVDVAGFSGEKLTVTCEKYGLAFGLTWEMMEGNNYNAFRDAFMNYEDELYGTTADVHYAVIRACADDSSNSAVTYQSGANTLEKDVATINAGVTALLNQIKDTYGASANTPLYIVADIALRERINRAMRTVNNIYDAFQVNGNVTPIYTMNDNIRRAAANATTEAPFEPIIVLPGRRLQDAVHTSNLELTETDIRSLSKITAGWTAFGVGAGNVLQTKRVYFHS